MIDFNKQRYLLTSCLAGVLFASASYADLPESRITPLSNTRATPGLVIVPITGYVLAPPPCKINGDKVIKVDFEEVMSTRIDGVAYSKPINYNIECDKRPTEQMKMTLVGDPAGFDPTRAVRTNISGLGVGFTYNGSRLRLNQEVKFVYPNAPQFHAMPVRDMSKVLNIGGPFQAGVTIKLDYQ
ncbi:fimbrial protein [Providencia rettgeri]|nr:fimbrial protein [Providencia rettgeri]